MIFRKVFKGVISMQVTIKDDFDLEKIIDSGQCFRGKSLEDGSYRFISGDSAIYLRPKDREPGVYTVSCDQKSWETIWFPFFDLERCYSEIAVSESGKHEFVDLAIAHGRGVRLLRQDPWEMLLTFIISQRKSIPAIIKSVEALSEKYGHDIVTEQERLKAFPSPGEMKDATEEELAACGLGYRVKYILDAIQKVNSGELNLKAIAELPDDVLLEKLQAVMGVGIKVANCIALFAYGRTACVPVDVWIFRAIEKECGGISPFSLYGENAGIIQQYIFYYERGVIGKG